MSKLVQRTLNKIVKGAKLTKEESSLLRLSVKKTESGRFKFQDVPGSLAPKSGAGYKTEEALYESLGKKHTIGQVRSRLIWGQKELDRISKARDTLRQKDISKQRDSISDNINQQSLPQEELNRITMSKRQDLLSEWRDKRAEAKRNLSAEDYKAERTRLSDYYSPKISDFDKKVEKIPLREREIFQSDQLRAERAEIESFLDSGAGSEAARKLKTNRLKNIGKKLETIDPRIRENTRALTEAQESYAELPKMSLVGDVVGRTADDGLKRNPLWQMKSGHTLLERAVRSGVADKRSFHTDPKASFVDEIVDGKPTGHFDMVETPMKPTEIGFTRGDSWAGRGKPEIMSSKDLAIKVRAAEAEQGIDVARNKEFYEHAERMGFKRENIDEFLHTMGYRPDEAHTVMRHIPGKGTPLLDDTGRPMIGKDKKPLVRTRGDRDEQIVFAHEDPLRNISVKENEEGKKVFKETWESFNKPEDLEKKLRIERNKKARSTAKVVDETPLSTPTAKEPKGEEVIPPVKETKEEVKDMSFFTSEHFKQTGAGDRLIQGAVIGGGIGGANAFLSGNIPVLGEDGSTWEFTKAVGVGALTGGIVGGATRPLMQKTFSEGGIGSGIMNMGSGFAKSNPDSVFADTARNLGGMKKYFVGPESAAQEAASALTKADRNLMYTGVGLTSGISSSLSMSDNKSRGLNSNRGNRF